MCAYQSLCREEMTLDVPGVLPFLLDPEERPFPLIDTETYVSPYQVFFSCSEGWFVRSDMTA